MMIGILALVRADGSNCAATYAIGLSKAQSPADMCTVYTAFEECATSAGTDENTIESVYSALKIDCTLYSVIQTPIITNSQGSFYMKTGDNQDIFFQRTRRESTSAFKLSTEIDVLTGRVDTLSTSLGTLTDTVNDLKSETGEPVPASGSSAVPVVLAASCGNATSCHSQETLVVTVLHGIAGALGLYECTYTFPDPTGTVSSRSSAGIAPERADPARPSVTFTCPVPTFSDNGLPSAMFQVPIQVSEGPRSLKIFGSMADSISIQFSASGPTVVFDPESTYEAETSTTAFYVDISFTADDPDSEIVDTVPAVVSDPFSAIAGVGVITGDGGSKVIRINIAANAKVGPVIISLTAKDSGLREHTESFTFDILPMPLGKNEDNPALSCQDIKDAEYTTSNLYWVNDNGLSSPYEVWCDLESDGGGFQHVATIYDDQGVSNEGTRNAWHFYSPYWTTDAAPESSGAYKPFIDGLRQFKAQGYNRLRFKELMITSSDGSSYHIMHEFQGINNEFSSLKSLFNSANYLWANRKDWSGTGQWAREHWALNNIEPDDDQCWNYRIATCKQTSHGHTGGGGIVGSACDGSSGGQKYNLMRQYYATGGPVDNGCKTYDCTSSEGEDLSFDCDNMAYHMFVR